MRTVSMFSLVAVLAAVPAHAAPVCGNTLYGPVVLTEDAVCPPGVDGFIIGNSNVRIDLNGYAIIGPDTAGTTGVRSSGFDGVQIMGPGRIEGFERSVAIEGGVDHSISKIIAVTAWNYAISLRNSSYSLIERNRFAFLEITSDSKYRATGNRVVGNDVGSDQVGAYAGILLHGCDTTDNVVADNSIAPNYGGGVSLDDGTNNNRVIGNQIALGQVRVVGSSDNLIQGNAIQNDAVMGAGVYIANTSGWFCNPGKVLPARRNVVQGNRIHGGQVGVFVYSGTENQIKKNKFYDHTRWALFFYTHAVNNDARGNSYINTVIAEDHGSGNLWP
jgi:hypothetical protein